MHQSPVRSFKDLLVWQEAMILAEITYRLVALLPNSERYELSSQMRRASVSIPSNIAEGYARESRGSYLQFLRIARGSLRELETQILLTVRLDLLDAASTVPALAKCDQVGRLLHGLIRSIDATGET